MLALKYVDQAHILMSMRLDAVQVQRMLELRPAGQAHRLMVVGLDAVGLQRRNHWLAMRQNIGRYRWLAQGATCSLPSFCRCCEASWRAVSRCCTASLSRAARLSSEGLGLDCALDTLGACAVPESEGWDRGR